MPPLDNHYVIVIGLPQAHRSSLSYSHRPPTRFSTRHVQPASNGCPRPSPGRPTIHLVGGIATLVFRYAVSAQELYGQIGYRDSVSDLPRPQTLKLSNLSPGVVYIQL